MVTIALRPDCEGYESGTKSFFVRNSQSILNAGVTARPYTDTMRPEFPALAIAFAAALSGSHPARAGSVSVAVTSATGRPLAGAIVSIDVPGTARPAAPGPYVMAQHNIAFDPHILIVPVGATVLFPNKDQVRHHVYSFSRAKKFEIKLYSRDETKSEKFDTPGVVSLGCNIHDSMSGYLYVTATPLYGADRCRRARHFRRCARRRGGAAGVGAGDPRPGQHHGAGGHYRSRGAQAELYHAMIARPRIIFTKLRTRLAVQYGLLFGLGFLMVLLVAQAVIRKEAQRSVTADLLNSAMVYDRIWDMREHSLATAADVVSRDFGFRSAVASGDSATILSALATLKARTGVTIAAVVGLDGRVTGAQGELAQVIGQLPFNLAEGRRNAVVSVGHDTYRLIESPILAPTEIGWAVVAVRLDAAELRGLERLSAIPIVASILQRGADGHWHGSDPAIGSGPAIDALVAHAGEPATLNFGNDTAYALARPLAAPGKLPQAALLLRYSTALALAPYRPIQAGIVLAGLSGLLLVIWGSLQLAAKIAGPIAALQRAAQTLEEGSRTEVAVTGEGRDRAIDRELQPDVGGDHRARASHHPHRLA